MEQQTTDVGLPSTTFTLSTVHHCLARSASDPAMRSEIPMVTHTFRIPEELKSEVTAHCERHGSTLSSFLRRCCIDLLKDYR